MSDAWRRAKALFQSAIDLPEAERAAYLDRECDDATVRQEVRRLLELHERGAGEEFLCSPMSTPAGRASADPLIGRTLGGFRLVRRIGVGGMGAVYEAEQAQPRRRAAVKALRPGFATPSMLRRLEFESEILARLHHPGIAHVYAAGTVNLGDGVQPWFAMEFIEGRRLGEYARDAQPNAERALRLLLPICDAVQHAHQRGVIHRDLKPANILVVDDGAGPRTKILDFGVARVVGSDSQATMHTAAGEIVGTLSYMSPEQLSGDPADIDARCDVYALGVIGYELLSGRLPHDRRSSAVSELIRAIEQDEPRRLGAVRPALRGDVETIFAKALEKDPDRRYQSAADLAADIRRFLSDEPVLARRATAVYQFRKFARRNRPLVGGVGATILALAVGLVLYAGEARRARGEAARSTYEAGKATAINNFITNDFLMRVLAAANESASGQRLPIATLVDQASANIGEMFAGRPLDEAAVRNEVASIYYNLGEFESAAREFRLALTGWEAGLGPDHPDTLKAVNNLGQTMAHLQRPDDAEALYRRALEGRVRALGEDDPYTLVTMNNLAELLRARGRVEEAEAMVRRTLAAQRRVHGEAHTNTLTTMANLGTLLLGRGAQDEALGLHRRAHELSRETLGADHVMTLVTGMRLGHTLHRTGDLESARDLLIGVSDALERTLGPSHGRTIAAHRALARVYGSMDECAQATAHLRRALDGAVAAGPLLVRTVASIREEIAELESEGGAPPDGDAP